MLHWLDARSRLLSKRHEHHFDVLRVLIGIVVIAKTGTVKSYNNLSIYFKVHLKGKIKHSLLK